MPTEDQPGAPAIPLARWADRRLAHLAAESGSQKLAALDGATLLGERASHGGYRINGRVSAGLGGSRLMQTRDNGWFALTLIRTEDRDLLPALFQDADLDIDDNDAIARAARLHDCAELVKRGRDLGLPVASADETPVCRPVEVLVRGAVRHRDPGHRLLVVDLSAIWAGPLAGHLFWLVGAEVVKVESLSRPDLIRRDDPATFDLINQGKANIVVDFADPTQKAKLIDLIRRADVVIESSRPRALRHLGIDAEALVPEQPGLVWLSVTGHGARDEAANWTGIGNDCAVAGGLSRAMADVTGEIGYVGDAIADPLTGITTALEGWRALATGEARRIGLSMSAIVASAIAEERLFNEEALTRELRNWGAAQGKLFPAVRRRPLLAPVREIGADNARYLSC
ncbi:CoA transferase [Novosphingobium rhizovicinum]|uniref:CoA transferase n=1 Tax=Novosphingobium rhizovicinum TaxID=3228928 RepID=A0ABV3R8G9_9SPHN